MPPKRRASPKGRPNRGKFKCTRCERLVNGDERNNHINKIHDGDQSVQFNIFCGDESKQPKLSFVKSVSKVPPSDDSTADGNGNLVLALAAATVHEESVPPVPVFRVHDCQTIILSESDSSSVYIIASNLPLLEPRRKFVDCDQECLQVRLSLALLLLQVHILH